MGELQNCISGRLKEGAERQAEAAAEDEKMRGQAGNAKEPTGTAKEQDGVVKKPGEKNQEGIAFADMMQAYEALRSDDKGSRARTTKEGFLHYILVFLEKQGLIDYVEQDEMVKTTKKLDNFMDWNLLNQNNYKRVMRVLGVTEDE